MKEGLVFVAVSEGPVSNTPVVEKSLDPAEGQWSAAESGGLGKRSERVADRKIDFRY